MKKLRLSVLVTTSFYLFIVPFFTINALSYTETTKAKSCITRQCCLKEKTDRPIAYAEVKTEKKDAPNKELLKKEAHSSYYAQFKAYLQKRISVLKYIPIIKKLSIFLQVFRN